MNLGVAGALVDGRIVSGDVEIRDNRIADIGKLPGAPNGLAIPGLIDLHINGFAGIDFLAATPDDYREAGDALARSGVTAYQPTFITSGEDQTRTATAAATTARAARFGRARVLGVHLEGPFLSPAYHGIHPVDAMRAPDEALLKRLLDAGAVSMVTLAPELDGALELVDVLAHRGVIVSIGHTDATAQQAREAIERGAHALTHVFNAMRPLRHRDPGVLGAALARDDVAVQAIFDEHHLAPEAAIIAWRCAGDRLVLVTDAIAAAGCGDGDYRVGGVGVTVRRGRAQLSDGTLAGNVATLLDGVRRLHALGASLEAAVGAATTAPARLLKLPDIGSLAPGATADVVVLDDRLEIVRVLVDGQQIT